MEAVPEGGIVSAAGFRAGAAHCGIKSAGGQPDVALIVADRPASAAGVFTTNKFAAPAVLWNRQRLPSEAVRAVVANSGNANACTGAQGVRDTQRMAGLVGELLSCPPGQVCVASTGVIGHALPMDKVERGIRGAHAALAGGPEAARAAERGIMTTDTRPKSCAVRSDVQGAPFIVGGMAKGSGMIAPHMATMLAFLTTDAAVPPGVLQEALRRCVATTFNCITVDGDSSTNDSIIVLASGASGATVTEDEAGADRFEQAIHAVLKDLALQVVQDGEGATKTIEVRVAGAATAEDAERAARAIAESQLVKCAVAGEDPNWGRIVCALGYSGARVDPQKTVVHIGATCVFRDGVPTGQDAAPEMKADRVALDVRLGLGESDATVWTCDLTEEYVRINAQYHT